MRNLARRDFILSTAALAVSGVASSRAKITPNDDAAFVRLPATGQSWRYAKHDLVTGAGLIHWSIACRQLARASKSARIQKRPRTRQSLIRTGVRVGGKSTSGTRGPLALSLTKYRSHGAWCSSIPIGLRFRRMKSQFQYGPNSCGQGGRPLWVRTTRSQIVRMHCHGN